MTTYVTVALQRIQSHLSRSRHLWGRRGASEEVVRLTMYPGVAKSKGLAEPPISRVLEQPGITLNDQALDIDGVLSFKGEVESEAREAGMRLAREFKDRMPGLTMEVSWVTDPRSYAELLVAENKSLWQRVTFQPVANEFPLVRPCDECRTSPASRVAQKRFQDDPGGFPRLCEDCFVRREHEERRSRTVVRRSPKSPTKFCTEWWLLEELTPGHPQLRGSEDLSELGSLLAPRLDANLRTHRDNHTALIAADGNGLGALFEAATRKAAELGSTEGLQKLSSGIHEAMAQSLKTATEAIWHRTAILDDDGEVVFPADKVLPVVPHLMGGDDLLVSLPGERAWGFLSAFLASFRAAAKPFDAADAQVSMSVGMVVCKAEHPFGNQVELANQLLRNAKQDVGGQGWSFTWLDLTHDGPSGAHGVWTLDELQSRRAALDHLLGMTASSRGALAATFAGDDVGVAAQKLTFLTKRMPEVASLIKLLDVTPQSLSPEDVVAIRDVASIGRWWR